MKSISFIILLTTLSGFAMTSYGNTACSNQARTPLEQLFCKIQLTAEGSTLPSFADFRRNQPKIQAMLLKRPARKLGLDVPVPEKPVSSARASEREPEKTSEPETKDAALKPITVSLRPESQIEKPNGRAAQNPLAQCEFRSIQIVCKNRLYELIDNKHNRYLAKDVLSEDNELGMARFHGDPKNETELNNYLVESYALYIQKMLDIGLGGVTMSYTKFYYTYLELSDSEEIFADRFETMYGFLKKDKATMLVEQRFSEKRPSGLQQCMDLNERLIVCDNRTVNWVYQLK
ncbi:hypothetical protein [Aurantivibrio infirmus]